MGLLHEDTAITWVRAAALAIAAVAGEALAHAKRQFDAFRKRLGRTIFIK